MEMFRAQSLISVFVLLMRIRCARAEGEAFEYAISLVSACGFGKSAYTGLSIGLSL